MTRRRVGVFLFGIAAYFAAAAVALLVVAPSLTLYPVGENVRTTATGKNLTIFDPAGLTVRQGVGGRVERAVVGDAAASGPDVAVYRSESALFDDAGTLLSATRYDFCVDRATARLRPDCPAARAEGGPLPWFGGPAWNFPYDVARQDQVLPDPAAGQPVVARYLRDGEVDGLPVYAFKISMPIGVVGRQEIPGEIAGRPPGTAVDAEVAYGLDRYLWVEPVSGVVVDVSERQYRFLRDPVDGRPLLPVVLGGVSQDRASVAADVARAGGMRDRITALTVTLPLAGAGAALVALVVGAWLIVHARRTEPSVPAGPPDPVTATVTAAPRTTPIPVGGSTGREP